MLSRACMYSDHGHCTRGMVCGCRCHRKDMLFPEPASTDLRWAAHQAVKAFDLKPNLDNARAASLALEQYATQLENTDDRGPQ